MHSNPKSPNKALEPTALTRMDSRQSPIADAVTPHSTAVAQLGRWAAHTMRTILLTLLFFTAAIVGYAADTTAGTTNALRFFIVSEVPIPGGHYVDTPALPKLGYISNAPSLVVTGLQSVAKDTGRTITYYNGKKEEGVRPGVTVQLLTVDGSRFAELTRQNVGHRVLLMLGDRPLVAPFVQSPVEAGSLTVTVHEQKEADNLLTELKKFVKNE
jgi:hypothetical protein